MTQNSSRTILATEQLGKTVSTAEGDLVILSGISFDVKKGESIAVVGASGSGKSTLLGLLAGLDQPSDGEIWLDGERFDELDEDQKAARRSERVGFVFQSFMLLPGLTAAENVMLPLELQAKSGAKEQAQELLEKVGLGSRSGHLPTQLSGGEQQRVALARAFITQPKLLFADEPTGNLDSVNSERVTELLFNMNQEFGTTLVLVTHDEKLAARCDRILRMDAGVLTEQPVAKEAVNVG